MTIRAGHGICVTAGDDVQGLQLVRYFAERHCHCRIDVAQQEVDLVAPDQLARLLHCNAAIGARRVLCQQLRFAGENTAFRIDLVDRQLTSDLLILAELGVGAGERIVETELDLVGSSRGDDEGSGELGYAGRSRHPEDGSAVELPRTKSGGHNHPSQTNQL